MLNIKRLSSVDTGFDAALKSLLAFEGAQDERVDTVVADILKDVKRRGDEAVLEYTKRFDRLQAGRLADLELPQAELQAALQGLPAEQRTALQQAADRVGRISPETIDLVMELYRSGWHHARPAGDGTG